MNRDDMLDLLAYIAARHSLRANVNTIVTRYKTGFRGFKLDPDYGLVVTIK